MKKMIALVMTIALLLGTVAMAEESTEKAINFADVESLAQTHEGQFHELEDRGLSLFLPGNWVEVTPAQEQLDNGAILALHTDVAETDPAYCTLNGQIVMVPFDDFIAALEKTGALTSGEHVSLNSIPAYIYELKDTSGIMAKGIAFHANPDDRTMTFAFAPVTDANADVVSLIMGSMMTTEALEASGLLKK